MNDFEIQRDLRRMNAPREPQRDLWTGIATRIEATPAVVAPAPRWRRPAFVVDVAEGAPEGFSLGGRSTHFVSRTEACPV